MKQCRICGKGWFPDIVISHGGWGCGLDVSWVYPEACRISYLEWWFANDADDYSSIREMYGGITIRVFELRQRNLSVALELSEAHNIITPTQWQRDQLLFAKAAL